MKKIIKIFFLSIPLSLFSQDIDVQKMFDIAMDSIILESSKNYYFMTKNEMLISEQGLENERICNFDFTSFESQIDIKENQIIFSKKNKIKRNNFINRLLFGQRLKKLRVFIPWQNQSKQLVMLIIINNKSRGKEYRMVFDKSNYNILKVCILSYIH